jgi:integrase
MNIATSSELTGPIPFADFTAELLALYLPPLRAKASYKSMRRSLEIAAEHIGEGATTANLTPDLIGRIVASRPPEHSPYTVNTLLTYLKVASNYAVQMGYLRASAFSFRKKWIRLGQPKVKKHHSMEEIARVLALMARDVERKTGWAQWRARRLQALGATVAYTGLRRDEALRLLVADVLLEERMILVVSRAGNRLKTERSAQPVPVPEALAKILADWLPHTHCEWAFPNVYRKGPWTGGSQGYTPLDRMKRLGVRAGVQGFTFQSLRHSWATHAEYWGLSDTMIQRVLRHTTTRTQMHYRHADADNLRSVVGGIDFGAPEASDGDE